MKKYWMITISGSRGLMQVRVDDSKTHAHVIFAAMKKQFSCDYVYMHEVSKNLSTGKCETKLIA